MDKVRFELHRPVEVTLTTTGEIVEGKFGRQTFYRCEDGRCMYLDLAVSQKLNILEVKPGETVGICKRGKGVWDVWLSPATEQMRAAKEPPSLAGQLRGSITEASERRYHTLNVPRLVAPASGNPGAGLRPAPVETAATAISNGPSHTGNSSSLIEEANNLVDVYAAVLDRALSTYQGRIKPDEIRSILLSCYIQQGKAAKYSAA